MSECEQVWKDLGFQLAVLFVLAQIVLDHQRGEIVLALQLNLLERVGPSVNSKHLH
jgi:hypothetical protein